jgi:hypothetical protein
VRDGQVLRACLGLARFHERLQRAVVDVVGDPLALDHADDHRVGVGLSCGFGRGGDEHCGRGYRRLQCGCDGTELPFEPRSPRNLEKA